MGYVLCLILLYAALISLLSLLSLDISPLLYNIPHLPPFNPSKTYKSKYQMSNIHLIQRLSINPILVDHLVPSRRLVMDR